MPSLSCIYFVGLMLSNGDFLNTLYNEGNFLNEFLGLDLLTNNYLMLFLSRIVFFATTVLFQYRFFWQITLNVNLFFLLKMICAIFRTDCPIGDFLLALLTLGLCSLFMLANKFLCILYGKFFTRFHQFLWILFGKCHIW